MTRAPDGPRLSSAASQEGFGLVEAIVAAAVLAVLALGVLAGIDGAAGSAGREKARAMAAALAERDQERMRAMRAVDLPGHFWSRQEPGTPFTIVSQAEWISDTSDSAVSCQSNGGRSDYLRLRTTVTSGIVGKRTAPVRLDSIMAPPISSDGGNNGTLTVQVVDRDDKPVAGVPVAIKGAVTLRTASQVTNAAGCAIFALISPDAYDVSFELTDWVNPDGVQKVVKLGESVTAGNTTLTTLEYDRKGSLAATFDTVHWNPRTSTWTTAASRGWALTLANDKISVNGGRRTFAATDGSPQATLAAAGLFPFKDGYGVYSGRCSEQNPSAFDDAWGDANAFRFVDRTTSVALTVRQPALPVRVSKGGTAASPAWFGGARVQAKLVGLVEDSQCAAAPDAIKSMAQDGTNGLQSYPAGVTAGGTNYSGTSAKNFLDGYQGLVTKKAPGNNWTTGYFDPGLPWGEWHVCADDGVTRNFVTVVNNGPNGFRSDDTTAFANLDLAAANAQVGVCSAGNWPAP